MRAWQALKLTYGDYWYKVRDRLHFKKDCLLIEEKLIKLQQFRQTILDFLHLTNPGAAMMLDLWEPLLSTNTQNNGPNGTELPSLLRTMLKTETSSRAKRVSLIRFCGAPTGHVD